LSIRRAPNPKRTYNIKQTKDSTNAGGSMPIVRRPVCKEMARPLRVEVDLNPAADWVAKEMLWHFRSSRRKDQIGTTFTVGSTKSVRGDRPVEFVVGSNVVAS